jgi:hypothetical protein
VTLHVACGKAQGAQVRIFAAILRIFELVFAEMLQKSLIWRTPFLHEF